ncbi:hypothetical protein MMC25_007565 [Agyrium rufum]|nr:hypothetical protein [Agyrium rufum]
MSFVPQTPQRPVPGAYFASPVKGRDAIPQITYGRDDPFDDLDDRSALAPDVSQEDTPAKRQQETMTKVGRASKTINQVLDNEAHYPEIDAYIGQGMSSEYDVYSTPVYAPFEQLKSYLIPDKIFEHYNRAQLSTMMGLFADIGHAWITIDNACYMWDYTNPNPELIGFEEQPNTITAVRLVTPRPGVFVNAIHRLLVVATTVEMILVGVSIEKLATGAQSATLYQTKMTIPVKGMRVDFIESSGASGRVFFAGKGDIDVYEFTYQQEERWFSNRCAKVNHTSKGLYSLTPVFAFGSKETPEHTIQLVFDETRNLLYTLSSSSSIRIFHLKNDGTLPVVYTSTLKSLLSSIGHMTSPSELITPEMKLVSISPISSHEASKLHLMITTSTGCRVYMSATSSYGSTITDASTAPSSMQVQHVRFPPKETPSSLSQPRDRVNDPASNQQNTPAPMSSANSQAFNTSSKALKPTRTATRYAPGYFFCLVPSDIQHRPDRLFASSPDTGQNGRPSDQPRASRFCEAGQWFQLDSRVEDIGLCSKPFAAQMRPQGFANELAMQYDQPSTEIAILTSSGVHTYRRRRLVDLFAAAIRSSGGDAGLETEVKRFIRLYGRSETCASALGVICGQSLNLTSDSRSARITDPEILEHARNAFIEYGGKPHLNENAVVDQSVPVIDTVRPSPRHEGLALYISRLVRSIWKNRISINGTILTATGFPTILPTVPLEKLRDIQKDLVQLQDFLAQNKTFIEGLTGPDALRQVSTKQEEIALQAEHRALHSLVLLLGNMIEGVSFVLVLFEERLEEILMALSPETRIQVKELTFEDLFGSMEGKRLAKELVKAIVNRNITNGSNVDTVAEALRRKCGSFCSAEDVILFKAQEQVKRAAGLEPSSEFARNLLNESLRLFKQVTTHISMDQLQWAVNQYIPLQFFAGAIQLALDVAQDMDKKDRALSWIADGRPEQDPRSEAFARRRICYNLIHQVIESLDRAAAGSPKAQDIMTQSNNYNAPGNVDMTARRVAEAYAVIDSSGDRVFQTDLYDWYLAQGQADRLLRLQSSYIITYLEQKATEDSEHADLLWKYHLQHNQFHEAAGIQMELAKSPFVLKLDRRIEYLSQAKANASTHTSGVGRQTRQTLIRETSDLLDVAQIQDELLQRLKVDPRMTDAQRHVVDEKLNGAIQSLSVLYNEFADQAEYYDLSLLIYQAADHRNPNDIRSTWQNFFESIHMKATEQGQVQPWEMIADKVRSLAPRLNLSESIFPVPDLIPLLERYAYEHQRKVGSPTWVVDIFIDLQVPYESIFPVLEGIFYNNEIPFHGVARRVIAEHIIYITQRWLHDSMRGVGKMFGGETNAMAVSETLLALEQSGIFNNHKTEDCAALRMTIDQMLR